MSMTAEGDVRESTLRRYQRWEGLLAWRVNTERASMVLSK